MTDVRQLVRQATSLAENNLSSEAEGLLRQALATNPNDRAALEKLAEIALRRHDHATAYDCIGKLLSADRNNPIARAHLFRLLSATHNDAEAEQVIRDLITDHPDIAPFHRLYAELMLQILRFDRARHHIEQALKLDPNDPKSQGIKLIVDTVERKTEDAGQELVKRIAVMPELGNLVSNLEALLLSEHRYEEAANLLHSVVIYGVADKEMLEGTVTLKVMSHWSTIPLRPYYWYGQIALWALLVLNYLIYFTLSAFTPYGSLLIQGFILPLGYILYSTLYPRLLKRWIRYREF